MQESLHRWVKPGFLHGSPWRTNEQSHRFNGHHPDLCAYLQAQSLQPSQAVVRLDGQYGNGAIVADLAELAYAMRGKDYDLLDQELVQARLAQPPDQQTTHPETGTCRVLFDFPDLLLSCSSVSFV